MKERSRERLEVLLLLIAALAAFSPCLANGFAYDDHRFIRMNPFMKGPLNLKAALTDPNAMEPKRAHDIYRPLRTLLFYLEHRLGGARPFLHHLAGLALHLANTWLVYQLIRILLNASTGDKAVHPPALMGAGLFALHPVQVESVAWISSRGDQLVAFFVLLSLIHAFRERRENGGPSLFSLLIIFLLSLLACLSKESGVILPGMILLAWVLVPYYRNRRILLNAVAAAAPVLFFYFWRSHVLSDWSSQVGPHGGGGLSNFFYASFGLSYQVTLIFRPWFSNVDYQSGFFDSIPFWQIQVAGLLYFGVVCLGLFALRRRPCALLALLFFCLAQFPTSSLLFTLRSLVNDRYLYLPMVGAGLLLALLLAFRGSRLSIPSKVYGILGILVLGLLALFTFQRTRDWHGEESLWTATLKTHPGSLKARVGLSTALFNQGEIKRALQWAEEAVEMTNDQPGTSLRADALLAAGKALMKQDRYDAAARYLAQSLREAERPEDPLDFEYRLWETAQHLWFLHIQSERDVDALWAAEKAVLYGGKTAQNLLFRAIPLFRSGKLKEALAESKEVLRLAPPSSSERAEAYHLAAQIFFVQGDMTEAARYLSSALVEADQFNGNIDFKKELAEISRKLWALEFHAEDYDKALWAAERLVRYGGETPQNLLHLGLTYIRLSKLEEAEAVLEKGASLKGRCAEIHYTLGDLYKKTGREEKGVREIEKGLEIQAESPSSRTP